MNNGMGDTRALGLQTKFSQVGPVDTLFFRLEEKSWNNLKGSDYQGYSGNLAAYYGLGKALVGTTQIQLGSSDLYARSTLVQGVLYKLGDRWQWVQIGRAHV